MTAHTPGPWAYCAKLSGSENHKGFYIKSREYMLVYDVSPVDQDGTQGEANARLIAAAPDLLDFIKRLSVYLPDDLQPEAESLIAKATRP